MTFIGAIGVYGAGYNVGLTCRIAPIRRIVAADAEVRTTDDLEIIGETWMPHRKIVRCEIDLAVLDNAMQVRLVGIADNLLISMVLHHDHEEVIEMRNGIGIRAVISEHGAHQTSSRQQGSCRLESKF